MTCNVDLGSTLRLGNASPHFFTLLDFALDLQLGTMSQPELAVQRSDSSWPAQARSSLAYPQSDVFATPDFLSRQDTSLFAYMRLPNPDLVRLRSALRH